MYLLKIAEKQVYDNFLNLLCNINLNDFHFKTYRFYSKYFSEFF